MNLIGITGRLTADPELKVTQSGVSVCSFTLAVKRPHTNDTTDFISVSAWRQSAEFLSRYAHKGNMVGVTGTLTSRKWQDRNGQNRTQWEIVADYVELLESRVEGASAGKVDSSAAINELFDDIGSDDDVPF